MHNMAAVSKMVLTKCLFTFLEECGAHQIEFKCEIFLGLILVRISSFLEIPCLKSFLFLNCAFRRDI